MRSDVINGLVSVERAREEYGVVIGSAGFAVDLPATAATFVIDGGWTVP